MARRTERSSSAYGATATADDVLASRDLSGKRVLVTGVSSGVGVETARALVAHGATVVGTARDMAKGAAATGAITRDKLELVALDLASLASVRACADALLTHAAPFDAVIANAGVMAVPFALTTDGVETQFATNYLGHFVLVNRLAGLLGDGGRVVMVSSAGHRGADVDLADPNFARTPYDPLLAYRRSKTAMILFAVAFDRRHKGRGVRATAVHPGAVLTETTRKLITAQPSAAAAFTWKDVAQGAATSVWAGFVADVNDVGGRYCEDCDVAEVNDDPTARVGVRSYALDPRRAESLWGKSVDMVGERY
jgi:NAD(P)-dependent dehydrogenase (short-subunit alcohol dehydrogenase family)